jgi:tetratricopeptide (TPR) repeat protein
MVKSILAQQRVRELGEAVRWIRAVSHRWYVNNGSDVRSSTCGGLLRESALRVDIKNLGGVMGKAFLTVLFLLFNLQPVAFSFDNIHEMSSLYESGKLKYEKKDYAGAIKDFSDCISINPIKADTYDPELAMQSVDWSINDYFQAPQLVIALAETYNSRGRVQNALLDHYSAISDFSTSIKLNPNNYSAYLNRGVSKAILQRYHDAISDFSVAIAIKPDAGYTYYLRSLSWLALNNRDAEKNDLDKAKLLGFKKP